MTSDAFGSAIAFLFEVGGGALSEMPATSTLAVAGYSVAGHFLERVVPRVQVGAMFDV